MRISKQILSDLGTCPEPRCNDPRTLTGPPTVADIKARMVAGAKKLLGNACIGRNLSDHWPRSLRRNVRMSFFHQEQKVFQYC